MEIIEFIANNWNIFKWIFISMAIKYAGEGFFVAIKGSIWLFTFIMKRKDLK